VSSRPRVTLFIDPPSCHFERDRLFEVATAPVSGDRRHKVETGVLV